VGLTHPGDGKAMGRYTETYQYDEVGNIARVVHSASSGGWTRRYAYDEPSLIQPTKTNNRLSATTVGNTPASYSHDAHGNMTSMPHLPLMRWDHEDQLRATSKQVVGNGGTPETTHYVYDSAGQRVRKVTERQAAPGNEPSRKVERIYLGGYEVYREYNNNGVTVTLARESLHVMDDQQRIALVETRTQGNDPSPKSLVRYQLSNHLGSASLELDDQAQIISYEEYFPYGSTSYQAGRSAAEVSLKRYRYTGKERDEETGLSYHGARYYAPWLSRWATPDPGGLVDGINVYSYARNSPLSFVDPEGTDSDEPVYLGARLNQLQEVHYWGTPGSGWIVGEYDPLNQAQRGTFHYYERGSKTASAILDPETGDWLSNETIEVHGFAPPSKGGFIGGALDQAFHAVVGVYQMVRHPKRTAKALWYMATHPVQTVKAIGSGIKNRASAIWYGDTSYEAGKTFTDVIGFFLAPEAKAAEGAKIADVGVDLAKVAKAAEKPTILADTDLLINAAEKGSANSLATIRGANTVIPSTTRSELLHGVEPAQQAAREAFLKGEGITTYVPREKWTLTEAGEEVWQLIDETIGPGRTFEGKIAGGHSPNDAILAAISKVTGFPIRTGEKRLPNFFNHSMGRRFGIDIQRVQR
jgi:RHS repeat-associated protein